MPNILLRFSHGLGDCVQLTVVLQHLRKHRPELRIDVQVSDSGKASLFAGFENVRAIWNDKDRLPHYDDDLKLDWWEPDSVESATTPATKAEQCLRRIFQIEPEAELCNYVIPSATERSDKIEDYLKSIAGEPGPGGRYRAVVIHYQGNTAAYAKNLDHDTIFALCQAISERGYVSIILDWDARSPLPNGQSIHCPHAAHPLWEGIGTGHAGTIAQLIQRCAVFVGIDSGPQKVAGATDTPTLGVWRHMHPVHYYGFGNALHIVPENHEPLIRGDLDRGLSLFRDCYSHVTYSHDGLSKILIREVLRKLNLAPSEAERALVAYSFCGEHLKSAPFGVSQIPAQDHWQMLLTAMNSWNPDQDHREIVVSVGAVRDSIPEAIFARGAHLIAIAGNPGHQAGAFEAIRHAAVFARRNRFTHLVMLADDVLPTGCSIASLLEELGDGDYIGTSWGRIYELNTQVFAARVEALFDEWGEFLVKPIPVNVLEENMYLALTGANRTVKRLPFAPDAYYWHTHDPSRMTDFHATECYDKILDLQELLLSTRWVYCRLGYDSRPIKFEADGSISEGEGGMEKEWRASEAGRQGAVVLRGDHGATCTCAREQNDWFGQWRHFERMPIVLTPIAAPDPQRAAGQELEQCYEHFRNDASNINEHLNVLRRLANECSHVTELGTGEGRATSALLAAQPGKLVTVDKEDCRNERLLGLAGLTELVYLQDDTRDIELEPTDMLFIDTYQTRDQIATELARHGHSVRRIIAIHDTSTFGETGEDGGPGITPAIQEWLQTHQADWFEAETYRHNNGMQVFRRRSRTAVATNTQPNAGIRADSSIDVAGEPQLAASWKARQALLK